MTDREPTDAELLNTGEPGNEAGKPIQEGTVIDPNADADADREQLDPADHDSVWADA